MTTFLRACPFCSRADNPAPIIVSPGTGYYVQCLECKATGPKASAVDDAVSAWNTRPFTLNPPPAKLEFKSYPPSEDEPAAGVDDAAWLERQRIADLEAFVRAWDASRRPHDARSEDECEICNRVVATRAVVGEVEGKL